MSVMRKIFVIAAAVAAVFMACSCQKEQPIGGVKGPEATVTFTVDLPVSVQTKSISQAEYADVLLYQVWNSDQTKQLYPIQDGEVAKAEVVDVKVANEVKKGATVQLSLVKDQTYTFIFWAQNSQFKGFSTPDLRNVKVDYSKFGANSDYCDAFYAHEVLTVSGPIEQTITLTRPFAQLNFGTSKMSSDLGDINLEAVQVEVSKLSYVFNTKEGKGDTNWVQEKVVFNSKGLATTEKLTTADGDFTWVKMDYLLMQEEQDNVNITATFEVGIEDMVVTHVVPSVPLRVNHRTNIVGELFTTDAKLAIIIDELFCPTDLAPGDAFHQD